MSKTWNFVKNENKIVHLKYIKHFSFWIKFLKNHFFVNQKANVMLNFINGNVQIINICIKNVI